MSPRRLASTATYPPGCNPIDVDNETDTASGPFEFGVEHGGGRTVGSLTAAEIETLIRLKFVLLVDVHFEANLTVLDVDVVVVAVMAEISKSYHSLMMSLATQNLQRHSMRSLIIKLILVLIIIMIIILTIQRR